MTRDEAIANNNWYSPDLKVMGFVGAEGQLVVVINGAMQYLKPFGGHLVEQVSEVPV